jgi:hypothetical protein
MDVRVEARPLAAAAVSVEAKTIVEIISNCVILSPVVSRFSLAPVISVGGNSISSITPESYRIGVKAAV